MDRRVRGEERCGHRGYPVVVGRVGVGRTARCLGCGRSGPVRPSAAWALAALRDEPRRSIAEAGQWVTRRAPAPGAAESEEEFVRLPISITSTRRR